MILAYKNGTLIAVSMLKQHLKTTIVTDYDGKRYYYRESDENRMLFSGKNAVPNAIKWVESHSK